MSAQHLDFDAGRLRIGVEQTVVSEISASIARIEAYSETRRDLEGPARQSSHIQQVEASAAHSYFKDAKGKDGCGHREPQISAGMHSTQLPVGIVDAR